MNKTEGVIVILGLVIAILIGYIISTNHKLDVYEKMSNLINQSGNIFDNELNRTAMKVSDCEALALKSEKNFERCLSLSKETFFSGIVIPEVYNYEMSNHCRLNNPTKFVIFASCLNYIE